MNRWVVGHGRRGGRLCGRVLARPAVTRGLRRSEVDGVGRAADLQFLPQCFRRRGKPAPDRLGRLARFGLQLPRLSGSYALDVAHVFLEQRRALAGCAVRAGFVQREGVKRGQGVAPAYRGKRSGTGPTAAAQTLVRRMGLSCRSLCPWRGSPRWGLRPSYDTSHSRRQASETQRSLSRGRSSSPGTRPRSGDLVVLHLERAFGLEQERRAVGTGRHGTLTGNNSDFTRRET